jgi:hypothetical protein
MLQPPRALLAVLLLALVGCPKGPATHTFELPRSAIQEKVEKAFPINTRDKQDEGAPAAVIISSPEVLLEDGKDQIGLRVNLTIEPTNPPGPPATGKAIVFFSVGYDAQKKAIYIANPKLTELKIDKLPDEFSRLLAQVAERALGEKLAAQSIPLEREKPVDIAVRAVLKSVAVKGGKVFVTVGL